MPLTSPRQPDQVDQHVGQQVRLQRKNCRMSMKQLAEKICITYQQVQKYETGANRIPVSRLALIAELLGGSPGDFYPDASLNSFAEGTQQSFSSLSHDEQRLLRAFKAIPSQQAQKALLDLADQMVAPFSAQKPGE